MIYQLFVPISLHLIIRLHYFFCITKSYYVNTIMFPLLYKIALYMNKNCYCQTYNFCDQINVSNNSGIK